VVPYLCYRFRIFDRPVLKKYVYQVEGLPTCFSFAYVQREMAFLQLRICIFLLKVWQLRRPRSTSIFYGLPP
jgi:hypothetical protein